jgi:hypothetical protein
LVDVKSIKDGFLYALGKSGGDFCATIKSEYAENYRKNAALVIKHLQGKTDRTVMGLIKRYSIDSIRKSKENG